MQLHETLCHLFPNWKVGDWMLCDVGAGAFIAKWNRPEPEPTLAQLNEAAPQVARQGTWEAIKAKRDHLSDTGGYKVVVGGVDKWFHSDAKSKVQQLGLVLMGAAVSSVPPWKTMDGNFVTMTQALAGQIFAAAATMDGTLFSVAEAHRTAMLAAPDPAVYDFSGGWPALYVAA